MKDISNIKGRICVIGSNKDNTEEVAKAISEKICKSIITPAVYGDTVNAYYNRFLTIKNSDTVIIQFRNVNKLNTEPLKSAIALSKVLDKEVWLYFN